MAVYDPKMMDRLLFDLEKPQKRKSRARKGKHMEHELDVQGGGMFSVVGSIAKALPKAIKPLGSLGKQVGKLGTKFAPKLTGKVTKFVAPLKKFVPSFATGSKLDMLGNAGSLAMLGYSVYSESKRAKEAEKAAEQDKIDRAQAEADRKMGLEDRAKALEQDIADRAQAKKDREDAEKRMARDDADREQGLRDREQAMQDRLDAIAQDKKDREQAEKDRAAALRDAEESKKENSGLNAAQAALIAAQLAQTQQDAIDAHNFALAQIASLQGSPAPSYGPPTTAPTTSYKPPTTTSTTTSSRRGRGMRGGLARIGFKGNYRSRGPVDESEAIRMTPPQSMSVRVPNTRTDGRTALQAVGRTPPMHNNVVSGPLTEGSRTKGLARIGFEGNYRRGTRLPPPPDSMVVRVPNTRTSRGVPTMQMETPLIHNNLVSWSNVNLPKMPLGDFTSDGSLMGTIAPMAGSGRWGTTKASMVSGLVHHFGISKAQAKKIIKMHNL